MYYDGSRSAMFVAKDRAGLSGHRAEWGMVMTSGLPFSYEGIRLGWVSQRTLSGSKARELSPHKLASKAGPHRLTGDRKSTRLNSSHR